MPTIVPPASIEGPPIPSKPIDTQRGDMGYSIEFEMGEQIEAPKLSTSTTTSTSELVGAS